MKDVVEEEPVEEHIDQIEKINGVEEVLELPAALGAPLIEEQEEVVEDENVRVK